MLDSIKDSFTESIQTQIAARTGDGGNSAEWSQDSMLW